MLWLILKTKAFLTSFCSPFDRRTAASTCSTLTLAWRWKSLSLRFQDSPATGPNQYIPAYHDHRAPQAAIRATHRVRLGQFHRRSCLPWGRVGACNSPHKARAHRPHGLSRRALKVSLLSLPWNNAPFRVQFTHRLIDLAGRKEERYRRAAKTTNLWERASSAVWKYDADTKELAISWLGDDGSK